MQPYRNTAQRSKDSYNATLQEHCTKKEGPLQCYVTGTLHKEGRTLTMLCYRNTTQRNTDLSNATVNWYYTKKEGPLYCCFTGTLHKEGRIAVLYVIGTYTKKEGPLYCCFTGTLHKEGSTIIMLRYSDTTHKLNKDAHNVASERPYTKDWRTLTKLHHTASTRRRTEPYNATLNWYYTHK